jgi:NifU-like protein
MSFYPPKINGKFHAPQNVGRATGANAVGTGATFVCGTVLRFTLRIDKQTKEILEAKFKTNGCGYTIASAEILAEKVTGKHLAELQGLDEDFLQKEIEDSLGEFEEHRKHCLRLATDALHGAFADFRAAQIEEWTGEKALVCTCFGVSEDTIEKVIEKEALETVEAVTEACHAGGGCGSCQPLIEDILDVYWRERG